MIKLENLSSTWRIAIATVILFSLLATLRLHGYSLPVWHTIIDDAPRTEELWGKSRPIRSDDWAVTLPTLISQANHTPPFPTINETIGLGKRLSIVHPVPAGWITVFRPQTWGYFAGLDFGLAWMWWFHVLGLFLCGFLLTRALTMNAKVSDRHRFILALSLGVASAGAPLMAFFSYNQAITVIYISVCLILILRRRSQQSPLAAAAWGLALGYATACFVFGLYPPYQISVGYAALVVTMMLVGQRVFITKTHPWRTEAIFLSTGALFTILVSVIWYLESQESLQLLLGTDYPGQRFESGGNQPWHWLFRSNITFTFNKAVKDWSNFANVSEQGAYFFVFPFVMIGLAYELVRQRQWHGPTVALLLYNAFLIWFIVGDIPHFLASATIFSMCPPRRVIIALGFIDLILLAWYYALPRIAPVKWERALIIGASLAICTWLAWQGQMIGEFLPKMEPRHLAWAVFFNILVGVPIALKHISGPMLFALVTLAGTYWFNPIVRGGANDIVSKPLAQTIMAIDKAAGQTRWVTFGTGYYVNYNRMLDVADIAGSHYYPNFEFWRHFDPQGRQRSTYNRYAHVYFVAKPMPDDQINNLVLRNGAADQMFVEIDPRHQAFAALGIDFFLVPPAEQSAFDRLAFKQIARDERSNFAVYAR